jgi:hypothetical protein
LAADATAETFQDGDNGEIFWVPIDRVEHVDDAIAEVAKLVGPFEDHVYAEQAVGRVEKTSDGWRFVPDVEGDFFVWQVEAI